MVAACLRRWWLCWRQVEATTEEDRALGRRADLRVAWQMPKAGKGRREVHRLLRGMDHDRPHSPDHSAACKVSISLKAFRVRLLDFTLSLDIGTAIHPGGHPRDLSSE